MISGPAKILLLIICVLCNYNQGFSQEISREHSPQGTFRLNSKSDGIKGTPFLFDMPTLGKISLGDGKVYENIPFNILPEKNQVFIHMSGEDNPPLAVKNWEWIETVEEKPRIFRKEIFEAKPQIMEIIYESDAGKFVALHRKRLVKPNSLKDGYSGDQYDTFHPETTFYLLKGLEAEEIKISNAGLKSLAGEKFNALKQFIKQNKLDSKDTRDLKLIFEFIDQ